MSTTRLAVACLVIVACDDEEHVRTWTEQCTVAVVASDYRSSEVSLLTDDGSLCVYDVIDSGSRPPGLLTALSGDLVLPSEPGESGRLYLIDRYPNAVLTVVSRDSGVTAQIALSPGYAGNPQDMTFGLGGAIVSLLERPSEPLFGSTDLLVLDSHELAGAAGIPGHGRQPIDLSTYADPGLDPMPARFARADGSLWVGLTHLARDFSQAGSGRVVRVDTDELKPGAVIDLAPFQNCGNIAAASPTGGLWVVCSGLFRNSPAGPQREHSGLAYIAPYSASSELVPTLMLAAADLHVAGQQGRPLGFTIAALDDERAFVVALGDLETDLPDRLLLVQRPRAGSPDPVIEVVAESGPFELGAVLPLLDQQIVLVADADPRNPRVRRFTWPTATAPARELSSVRASASGLPPRHLARIR